MTNKLINTTNLRKLIGQKVEHNGQQCQVIEVLEDGPALILKILDRQSNIKADAHGEAHRKVPTTITLPVFDGDGDSFSPDFNALALDRLL